MCVRQRYREVERERERDEIDKGISVNIDRGREIEKKGKESKGERKLREVRRETSGRECTRKREIERHNKYFIVSHTTDTKREKEKYRDRE